jgi:hypothetical protein
MAMPAGSQGLKNRPINSSATALAPNPVNAHQGLVADEADPGEHEAGGGHEGDDHGQGPGVANQPGVGGAERGIRAGRTDPDEGGQQPVGDDERSKERADHVRHLLRFLLP